MSWGISLFLPHQEDILNMSAVEAAWCGTPLITSPHWPTHEYLPKNTVYLAKSDIFIAPPINTRYRIFDALEAAKKRHADFLFIDTAGRLHTKFNLMEELKKIRRVVTKADMTPEALLVLDATTGQNGLSQARYFTEAVTVSGIFLAKLDSTAKGGIVLAICDQLKIPIFFIGTGQELEHLAPFRAKEFVEALLLP
jgi:signal recognition particle GTPase